MLTLAACLDCCGSERPRQVTGSLHGEQSVEDVRHGRSALQRAQRWAGTRTASGSAAWPSSGLPSAERASCSVERPQRECGQRLHSAFRTQSEERRAEKGAGRLCAAAAPSSAGRRAARTRARLHAERRGGRVVTLRAARGQDAAAAPRARQPDQPGPSPCDERPLRIPPAAASFSPSTPPAHSRLQLHCALVLPHASPPAPHCHRIRAARL